MLSSIQNYYERLVIDCIHDRLGETDAATDPEYLADLACVALNRLPPRYLRYSVDLVSHLGDAEQAAMQQEVQDAVEQAMTMLARRQAAR
jgi:competence protein ComFB